MFPPGFYGVGVSIAALEELPLEGIDLDSEAEPWPSRLGELLPVWEMTAEQKAFHLQRLQARKAEIEAFEAELIVGLAEDRPASADRQRGQAGAASGQWAAQLLDE